MDTKELDKLTANVASVSQEDLNYIRVCVKYLMFDLEATRREKEYYVKLLHDTSDPSDLSDMF